MKEISAGGVVYRNSGGKLEIQMIQDRYGKITLPKGKIERGETIEQTALREIREETGMVGRIRGALTTVRYQYELPEAGKVDKEVHYFLVEAIDGEQKAQEEEIRGVEWLSPEEAWKHQLASGYSNNDEVLEQALAILGIQVNGLPPDRNRS
jgi:8-oxo-dGTP pyrophosphatase MutT (NUDIX family)